MRLAVEVLNQNPTANSSLAVSNLNSFSANIPYSKVERSQQIESDLSIGSRREVKYHRMTLSTPVPSATVWQAQNAGVSIDPLFGEVLGTRVAEHT